MKKKKKLTTHIGDTGEYYVSFKLSQLGWDVARTNRGTKGVDLIAFNPESGRTVQIQVKATSGRSAVFPKRGGTKKDILADYWVIVTDVFTDNPTSYILKSDEVKKYSLPYEVLSGKTKGDKGIELRPGSYNKNSLFINNWTRIK